MASETSGVPIPSQASLPLQDRVAIVTGASRGIGRAIALHLASLGAKLVINYTSNSTQADLVATEINSNSSSPNTPRAITLRADVSDPTQVKSLFDKAEETFNLPVHILVNNAGAIDSKFPTIANTSVEDFDNVFRYLIYFLENPKFFFYFHKIKIEKRTPIILLKLIHKKNYYIFGMYMYLLDLLVTIYFLYAKT